MRGLLGGWWIFAALLLALPAPQAHARALVTLVEHQSENGDESALLDRLTAAMIRNATRGSYAASAVLLDDSARKEVFLETIERYAAEGHEIDVFVIAKREKSQICDGLIPLSRGGLGPRELEHGLRRSEGRGKGGVRFVYLDLGSVEREAQAELVRAWRASGADAVLAVADSTVARAPFFLPNFLHRWGRGDSVTQAAARAGIFSAGMTRAVEPFAAAPPAPGTVVAPEPFFEGADVNIHGREAAASWRLAPVTWPERRSAGARFEHRPLVAGLLGAAARGMSPDIELKADRIPSMGTLVDALGDGAWSSAAGVFPGSGPNELMIPGRDVRIILGKIIPDLDQYLQQLIDHLENIVVTREEGKMAVEIRLVPEELVFPLREKRKAKSGQPYAVKLKRVMRFEIHMRRDSIIIDGVKGVTAMIKLPFLPDGVRPLSVTLDTSTETLIISAEAIGGVIKVVGKADVRAREFEGVDWLATILKNMPLLVGFLFFSAVV